MPKTTATVSSTAQVRSGATLYKRHLAMMSAGPTVVTQVLPSHPKEIREFLDARGQSPFGEWFSTLDHVAAAKVRRALVRLELGHESNVKGVGRGVLEYRLAVGPGYRIYFGQDGDALVILLAGGTKRRQQRDIENAWHRWEAYRQRKRTEGGTWH